VVSDALLVVLNPRRLPECMLSLEQIDAPKVWVRNYTELELECVIPEIIQETKFDYYVVISDDVIASTDAFKAVVSCLEDGYTVATGWCNLDPKSEFVSLTKTPPQMPYGTEQTYDWMTYDEVFASDNEIFVTFHPSMAMTGMSHSTWEWYPWRCFGKNGKYGWAADLDLSIRLHQDGIPIVAPRGGFMYHTKPDWKLVDAQMYHRRRLYVDEEPAELVWDL